MLASRWVLVPNIPFTTCKWEELEEEKEGGFTLSLTNSQWKLCVLITSVSCHCPNYIPVKTTQNIPALGSRSIPLEWCGSSHADCRACRPVRSALPCDSSWEHSTPGEYNAQFVWAYIVRTAFTILLHRWLPLHQNYFDMHVTLYRISITDIASFAGLSTLQLGTPPPLCLYTYR